MRTELEQFSSELPFGTKSSSAWLTSCQLKMMGLSSLALRVAPKQPLKVCALVFLTLQNTALVLATKFSYRESATQYVVSSVITCSESLKLVLSCALVLSLEGKSAFAAALREMPTSAIRLSLPSILYVVQNNLLFEGVRLLSPTMYAACSQTKILTSAFFGIILLKTWLTRRQVFALFVLVVGMIFVQIGDTSFTADEHVRSSAPFYGFVVVLTASITSGFAGAYLEKIYKEFGIERDKQRSIWFRNTQLACFSVPFAALTMYWRDGNRISVSGTFVGYDGVVIFIIALQAIGGLVVAAVMRYASNVLKCFAVSLSICNCALATTYLFNDGKSSMGMYQAIGILLVIGATFAYTAK